MILYPPLLQQRILLLPLLTKESKTNCICKDGNRSNINIERKEKEEFFKDRVQTCISNQPIVSFIGVEFPFVELRFF